MITRPDLVMPSPPVRSVRASRSAAKGCRTRYELETLHVSALTRLTSLDALSPSMPLSTPTSPRVAALAEMAWSGQLALCAGAGVSIPSGLPSGLGLANGIFDALQSQHDLAPELRDDLVGLADHVDALPGGRAMLRAALVRLFRFLEAVPALAHRILAILCTEGAAVVMVTNWDNCVERGSESVHRLEAIITASDAAKVPGARLLKIHGCATRQDSLLISTTDLNHVPLWVDAGLGAALANGAVVFVGVGDIADHTQKRLAQLVQHVIPADVCVVSPTIVANWDDSAWADVLPELPTENRLENTADAFLDELLRALLAVLLSSVSSQAQGLDSDELATATQRLAASFAGVPALQLAVWLQESAFQWRTGDRFIRSEAMIRTLIALAWHARAMTIDASESMTLRLDGQLVELLLSQEAVPGSKLRTEGERRLAQARTTGTCRHDESVLYVCLGHVGNISLESVPVVDIVDGEGEPGDLIGGPLAGSPTFVSAEKLLEEIA